MEDACNPVDLEKVSKIYAKDMHVRVFTAALIIIVEIARQRKSRHAVAPSCSAVLFISGILYAQLRISELHPSASRCKVKRTGCGLEYEQTTFLFHE